MVLRSNLIAILALGAVAVILAFKQPAPVEGQRLREDAVPVDALAVGPPVTPTRLNRALKIAKAYWPSRCERVSLHKVALPRLVIARATWLQDPNGRHYNCRITFNSQYKRLAFRQYCAAMVHEMGHLSGFRERGGPDGGIHSARRTNVMRRRVTSNSVPSVCKLVRDSGLARP